MPNIFQGTSFKKYIPQLPTERQMENFSKMFFYHRSTTDRKEKTNQFMKNVSLHPIDCIYENFKQYSSSGDEFVPQN